jgi:recombination protein RecT
VTGTAQTGAKEPGKALTFTGLVEQMKPRMAELLPKHLTPERMMTLVFLAAAKTPRLKECTPISLFTAVMNASRLGLEIGQHAHLVPFKNKSGNVECSMIPDFKGLVHLAVNSGKVKHIDVRVAYKDDDFDYALGSEPYIRHKPKLGGLRHQDNILCFYTIAWLTDGMVIIGEPMTKDEVDAIRKRSKAANDGPWVTDYVQMGKKTVVKRDCKMLPQTPELTAAIELDNRAESGELGTVSDLIDSARDVEEKVREKTSERAQEIKGRLAAGQRPADPEATVGAGDQSAQTVKYVCPSCGVMVDAKKGRKALPCECGAGVLVEYDAADEAQLAAYNRALDARLAKGEG